LLEKAIDLNRFRRFEYEYESEYEKAEHLPTIMPDGPEKLS
jgi:hypothetical protein